VKLVLQQKRIHHCSGNQKGIKLVVSTYLTIINIKFYKNGNLFRDLILSIVAKVRYKPKDEAC
jgi:hypothetical protein